VLIDSSCKLIPENLNNFILDAQGNWKIAVGPRNMFNDRDFYWQEVVILKAPFFCLSPGQAKFVNFKDMLQEL
jgi:hypothetical protein